MVFTREELNRSRSFNKKRRRIITFVTLGVILLLLVFLVLYQFTDVILGLSADLQSVPSNSDWVMFRHDMSRTGSNNSNEALPRGDIKWTFTTDGTIHSSPAVVDGIVYVGSRDNYVYALKADTGEKLWAFKTGSWVESSPIVSGGVVYIGSNDGYFYALDARTGKELWSFGTTYGIRSVAAVANGIVYFGSDDYCVYAVDTVTGKQVWKYKTGTQVTSSPVISDGVVVVGSAEGLCYTLNAKNGKPRLQFQTHSNVYSSPVVNNGVAYFTDSSGYFYAIDIRARNWPLENTIKIYWDVLYIYGAAPRPADSSGFIWKYNMGSKAKLTSSPALLGDKIYLGAGNNLFSLDVKTHQPGWSFITRDVVSSSPAVADKAVYVGSQDGRFYAVDRATGEKLWDIATGGQITSSPALVDGVIYFGSHDGKLYAIK
jgi:eukaryotic-like serine/threonine-protein kinase